MQFVFAIIPLCCAVMYAQHILASAPLCTLTPWTFVCIRKSAMRGIRNEAAGRRQPADAPAKRSPNESPDMRLTAAKYCKYRSNGECRLINAPSTTGEFSRLLLPWPTFGISSIHFKWDDRRSAAALQSLANELLWQHADLVPGDSNQWDVTKDDATRWHAISCLLHRAAVTLWPCYSRAVNTYLSDSTLCSCIVFHSGGIESWISFYSCHKLKSFQPFLCVADLWFCVLNLTPDHTMCDFNACWHYISKCSRMPIRTVWCLVIKNKIHNGRLCKK